MESHDLSNCARFKIQNRKYPSGWKNYFTNETIKIHSQMNPTNGRQFFNGKKDLCIQLIYLPAKTGLPFIHLKQIMKNK